MHGVCLSLCLPHTNLPTLPRHKQSSGKQYLIGRAAKDFKKVFSEHTLIFYCALFYYMHTCTCVYDKILQVSTAPPPIIPKQPLLPALEAPSPPTLMLEYPSPSSPRSSSSSLHSHTSSHHSTVSRAEGGRGSSGGVVWTEPEGEGSGGQQQGVFLTQVLSLPEP